MIAVLMETHYLDMSTINETYKTSLHGRCNYTMSIAREARPASLASLKQPV